MKVIKSREKRIRDIRVISGVLGILILVFIFVHVNMVNAGSQDSVLVKNRKDGVYAGTTLNGVNRLFYLNMYTMNGIPAYCIEIGVDISTDIYDSSNSYSGLSSVKQEYIKAVSYFGYKYKGHDDYRYYMASQEIIWEYLTGIDVFWTNVEDFNGERINIDIYKDEINSLVTSYYSNINFEGISNDIIFGKEYVINDKSNVLSNYYVSNKNWLDVSIDGNSIRYKLIDKNVDKASFRLKWNNYYSYNSKFYTSGNSQKLISAGNFINKVYDASFDVVRANLNICVVDKDTKLSIGQGQASLEGAIYEVYNNSDIVGTVTTASSGCGSINNLNEGDYSIRQVSSSDGYVISDEVINVKLLSGDNSVTLEEEIISNKIKFIKYFDGNRLEEGISFSIYDSFGNRIKDVLTNKEGIVLFDLVYGEYVVKQDNTTYGYNMVDDFNIRIFEEVNDTREYILNDDKIYGNVKISTKDKDSLDKILSNCFSYKIFDKNNNQYLDVFNTDNDGEVNISIGYGDYILEQVDVCSGYLLNDEKINFTIDGDNINVLIDFFNDKIVGNIIVHVDKEVFTAGDNEFGYDKIGLEDAFINIYKDDNLVDTISTDDKGNASIHGLELGNYCVFYDSFEECIVIEDDKSNNKEVVKYVNILVSLDKGNVKLNVLDDHGNYIDGVIVHLYNDKDDLIFTGYTSEDGTLSINNLVVGNYCFIEKSVPYEYVLNNDRVCFDIRNNDTSLVNIVNNKKVLKSIIIPDTYSDNSNYIKLFFMFFILVVGGFYYKYKKN